LPFAAFVSSSAWAGFPSKTTISFPSLALLLRDHRATYCPDCTSPPGFSVCGASATSPDSRHFRKEFFRRPHRVGYLLHHVTPAYLFAYELRKETEEDFRTKIRDDLSQARLIAVKADPLSVRVSAPPVDIELRVPQTLAECLRDPKPPVCASKHRRDCCDEQVIRSATAKITWEDPFERGRNLQLDYRLWPEKTLLVASGEHTVNTPPECRLNDQVYFE
jgi:hypothetical protein